MNPMLRLVAAVLCLALVAAGCAYEFKKREKAIEAQPIDCSTAQGDLRMLQQEKAHVVQEIAMGVTAIYPAGLVVGVLTGTEKTKAQVATGKYNHMIDEKIAAIKSTCGL
jgi:hypothetical protein